MFAIKFTPEAADDLRQLRKYNQQRIISAVETQLAYQPDSESRNRKRLRPNPIADWELRVGIHRVFYDVDAAGRLVIIIAIGYKQGNRLILRGKDHQL
jgi:mRNA-degrading endonuclease RelE of RelBE toxin-antitoxin system